jgi:ribosomal-protein-alanine N-acetyltransferase
MTLRKMTLLDIPQLLIVEEATQLSPWTEDVFAHCLQSGFLGWVLEDNFRILGFIISSLQAGESHILNLCVDVPFQRKGLGQQLLNHALDYAKTKDAMIAYLEVRRSNAHAIALYEKLGFVQISERKGYYPAMSGREDALVFAKDLRVE